MRQLTLWILLSVFLAFPAIVSAADRGGVGIIKGTITIAGKPATDAVVSVEGRAGGSCEGSDLRLQKRRKRSWISGT